MTVANDLRAIRHALNEHRMVNLSAYLAVTDRLVQHQVERKQQLVAELCAINELAAPVNHEDYVPNS